MRVDLRNKEERFVYRVIKTVELLNLLFVLFIREARDEKVKGRANAFLAIEGMWKVGRRTAG